MNTLAVLSGLLLLYLGAEGLVRGSSSLALRLGVSPLVVGLTIVAFGTSSPELVVSLTSSIGGHGGIAVGNVVGSNIFNIALILGLSALIFPLQVHIRLVRRDLPVMLAASVILLPMLLDKSLGRIEGTLLIVIFTGYMVLGLYSARKEAREKPAEDGAYPAPGTWSAGISAVLIVIGLAVLVAGARLLTWGAVNIARGFGVTEAVIGLTLVAAGTSLPELATSAVASFRGQPDIAVGNIVGSNIFNILLILGAASLAAPISSPGLRMLDLAAMLIVSAAAVPLMRSGFVLKRWEGALLLLLYLGYLYTLWP